MATINDKRAIGGNRVIADFSIKLSELAIASGRFNGKLIFNARGGMFFLGSGHDHDICAKIFRGCDVTSIYEMELSNSAKERVALLKNIKVTLIREKRVGEDYGMIVKFVQVTEENLDKLNALTEQLPAIDSDAMLFIDEDDPAPEKVVGLDVWEFSKKS